MDERINYYTLASVLLAAPGRNGILLTPMQLEYLDASINELLTEEEKDALRNNDEDWVLKIKGQSAINKLRKDPELMVILTLGEVPIKQLIDAMVCMISGEYKAVIGEDKDNGGYSLEFELKEPKEYESEDDRIINDFMNARVYRGPFRPYQGGSYMDADGEVIDSVYGEIIHKKCDFIYSAQYLNLSKEQSKAIAPSGNLVNSQLLDYYVCNEAKPIAPFTAKHFEQIKAYLEYWVGIDFHEYTP